MKRELFALAMVICMLVVFPVSLFAYQARHSSTSGAHVVNLVANSPANGGWQPDTIQVNLGEHVLLRISSTDTVHGFEIPSLGIQVDEVLPGHVKEIEFTASQVGRFPFACTRWCSVDHWRMRGTITVTDPANPSPALAPSTPPLYQQLKIDIDAMHPAESVPSARPSAVRGALLGLSIEEDLRTKTPSKIFAILRGTSAFNAYTDMQLWDAIAFEYRRAAGDDSIARGQALFAQDCAACHGETGKGNGTAGLNLPGLAAMHRETSSDPSAGMVKQGPADLTDASQMLGASSILLQGKVLRGGMGTGMPEWGSLYREQQMWDVIAYIRSFTFDFGK